MTRRGPPAPPPATASARKERRYIASFSAGYNVAASEGLPRHLYCVGCGALAAPGLAFKPCRICADAKMPLACYCLGGCLERHVEEQHLNPAEPEPEPNPEPDDGPTHWGSLQSVRGVAPKLWKETREYNMLHDRGSRSLESGDLGQAEASLRQAIATIPTRPTAYNTLGLCYLEAGERESASAQLMLALHYLEAAHGGRANILHNLLLTRERQAWAKIVTKAYSAARPTGRAFVAPWPHDDWRGNPRQRLEMATMVRDAAPNLAEVRLPAPPRPTHRGVLMSRMLS